MKKILIVDDEAGIRSIVSAMLAKDDREFLEASNGKEAQDLLGRFSFDLVISDVIMPDCDGFELFMNIRRTSPDLPFIIMSGGGRVHSAHYLNLAEKLGAAKVFEKPFGTKELRTAVADLFNEPEPTPAEERNDS